MRNSLLPTLGILLLLSGCSKAPPAYRYVGTIKDLMDSVVDPNADFVWDSVSIDSTIKGIVEKSPKTPEDWLEVRRHAIALMEATNLIQMPGRSVARPGEKADDPRVELAPEIIQTMITNDPNSWSEHAHGLYDATDLVLKAVEAKNVDALLDAGDKIDKACEACHVKYWYPPSVQKSAESTSVKK